MSSFQMSLIAALWRKKGSDFLLYRKEGNTTKQINLPVRKLQRVKENFRDWSSFVKWKVASESTFYILAIVLPLTL